MLTIRFLLTIYPKSPHPPPPQELLSYFVRPSLHTGVRAVRLVRRVRVQSVWRESAPSAVQTARSAPALQPQPSPAPHPANTPTGTLHATKSNAARTDVYPGCASVLTFAPHCSSSCSMSDDEQESCCDTVDSSPASNASGHSNSPFAQQRFIADGNHNREPRVACVAPETEPSRPTVRTVVVPPMRVHNNNYPAVSEAYGHSGKTGRIH